MTFLRNHFEGRGFNIRPLGSKSIFLIGVLDFRMITRKNLRFYESSRRQVYVLSFEKNRT